MLSVFSIAGRRMSTHVSTGGTDSPGLSRTLYARLAAHARLRQLQLLVAVDETGSIARAAARIPMSQSAATQALGELERIVDMALFERHARGVRPTPAGRALIAAARGAMAGLLDASESLAALRQGATAALRLGAIPAAAAALIPSLLARFSQTRPEVHLEVIEEGGLSLLPALFAGSLDAVFCREPKELPAEFVFERLLDDAVVVLAGVADARFGRTGLTLADLAEARWVLPPAGIQLREAFDAVVLAALPGAACLPMSTMSLPVLEAMLQQPGTVSLMPRSICASLLAGGRVRQLDVAIDTRIAPLGVAHLREGAPEALKALLAPALRGV